MRFLRSNLIVVCIGLALLIVLMSMDELWQWHQQQLYDHTEELRNFQEEREALVTRIESLIWVQQTILGESRGEQKMYLSEKLQELLMNDQMSDQGTKLKKSFSQLMSTSKGDYHIKVNKETVER